MKKKTWVCPQANVEKFVANEYVAACGKDLSGNYIFKCDAPGGHLYVDSNGDGRYDYDNTYFSCGKSHIIAGTESSKKPFYDGYIDYNGNKRKDPGEGVYVWLQFWDNSSTIKNAHASVSLTAEMVDTFRS